MEAFIDELNQIYRISKWSKNVDELRLGDGTSSNVIFIKSKDIPAVYVEVTCRSGNDYSTLDYQVFPNNTKLGKSILLLFHNVNEYLKENEEECIGSSEIKVANSEQIINKYFKA